MKCALLALLAAGLVGCDWMPGKPSPADRWKPAEANLDFTALYNENCRACHGIDGSISGSISLDQPTYLAMVSSDSLKEVITNGIPGSNMPAFWVKHGGPLSDAQIGVLVEGLISRRQPVPQPLPPYASALGGVAPGASSFGIFCASCHGADGKGSSAGSVVDADYLSLVSDQYLRTIVIAGRPELGCPDFRSRVEGRVMSDPEIADTTAWLASHRRKEFGAPIQSVTPTRPTPPAE